VIFNSYVKLPEGTIPMWGCHYLLPFYDSIFWEESQETGWNESLQNLMIGDSISNQHPTSFPLGTVPAGKDGNIKSPKVAEVHIHIVCMYRYVPIKTDTQT